MVLSRTLMIFFLQDEMMALGWGIWVFYVFGVGGGM